MTQTVSPLSKQAGHRRPGTLITNKLLILSSGNLLNVLGQFEHLLHRSCEEQESCRRVLGDTFCSVEIEIGLEGGFISRELVCASRFSNRCSFEKDLEDLGNEENVGTMTFYI